MVDYADRLVHAMALRQVDRHALAKRLGVTYQAVTKVIEKKSGAFSAENSAKAADFLTVDHYWLATGEGHPTPERAWPFELFERSDYELIDPEVRRRTESELAGEVQRARLRNGTSR